MTLIAHSRIPKNSDRPLAEVTRGAMTARSFQFNIRVQAIKLYYSMSTISYTPWFSYQINMTLIAHSRIPKNSDRPLAEVTRGAMTARSFQFNIRVQAIKLYYSMSTISYTPWFPYQFKMTLIECSRILKDRSLVEATRVGPP